MHFYYIYIIICITVITTTSILIINKERINTMTVEKIVSEIEARIKILEQRHTDLTRKLDQYFYNMTDDEYWNLPKTDPKKYKKITELEQRRSSVSIEKQNYKICYLHIIMDSFIYAYMVCTTKLNPIYHFSCTHFLTSSVYVNLNLSNLSLFIQLNSLSENDPLILFFVFPSFSSSFSSICKIL